MTYSLFNVLQDGVNQLVATWERPVRKSGTGLRVSMLTPESLARDVARRVNAQVDPLLRSSTRGREPYESLVRAKMLYLELPVVFEGCDSKEPIASDRLAPQYAEYGRQLKELQQLVLGVVDLARKHGFAT